MKHELKFVNHNSRYVYEFKKVFCRESWPYVTTGTPKPNAEGVVPAEVGKDGLAAEIAKSGFFDTSFWFL